jgi:hypothetical protein
MIAGEVIISEEIRLWTGGNKVTRELALLDLFILYLDRLYADKVDSDSRMSVR